MRAASDRRRTTSAVLVLAALLVRSSAAQDEPGWYLVEMEERDPFTARLVGQEEGFYILNFQGSVLRVARGELRRFERVAGAPSASGPRPGAEPAKTSGAASPSLSVQREEAIRDAIEALGSPEDAVARKAYRTLAADFGAARPFLHLSLRHQSPRVRSLSVKLVGEKGQAAEDLAPAARCLSDDRPAVRLAAVMALRALGPEALPHLLEHLERESAPSNRKMVVKTFQLWKEGRAAAPLVARLGREPDESVRTFIATALQAITGQKLGKDAAAWRSYLEREEGRRPAPGRPPARRSAAEAEEEGNADGVRE